MKTTEIENKKSASAVLSFHLFRSPFLSIIPYDEEKTSQNESEQKQRGGEYIPHHKTPTLH